MKSKPLTSLPALALAALVLTHPLAASAASPSELLEKGIYTEETKGDIDGAIAIYQQIADEAKTGRPRRAGAAPARAVLPEKESHRRSQRGLRETHPHIRSELRLDRRRHPSLPHRFTPRCSAQNAARLGRSRDGEAQGREGSARTRGKIATFPGDLA